MRVLTTIADVRAALDKERDAGRRIGFVPTMGSLHDGHLSLVRRARAECDVVAASVFVNPLQFGEGEDLDAYPRDLDRDLVLLEGEAADVVFAPSVAEMYPDGPATVRVLVGEIGSLLCGASRPGHFDGVATVVAKLFNIAGPCSAYFGEKDRQQLVILERLARALDFPVEVVGCPTVREPDGLAMSSRNAYLGAAERIAARALFHALQEAAEAVAKGEDDGPRLAAMMAQRLSSEPLVRPDYAACVDPESLRDLLRIEEGAVLAVAAWAGEARLIDNMTVTVPGAASIGGSE
jgi:pantoate--beta-alanine ligase